MVTSASIRTNVACSRSYVLITGMVKAFVDDQVDPDASEDDLPDIE